jgi:hypothetical protein
MIEILVTKNGSNVNTSVLKPMFDRELFMAVVSRRLPVTQQAPVKSDFSI